jgi:hypothetical protein
MSLGTIARAYCYDECVTIISSTSGFAMATGPTRKLVVVLDDDPGVLRAVQRLLSASGFDCELFSFTLGGIPFATSPDRHSAIPA